uniref:Uncharacterized protein n=1 Tax=viral metagenome TaxID=1070528 RepID=A0A6C0C204_9ZZZZ
MYSGVSNVRLLIFSISQNLAQTVSKTRESAGKPQSVAKYSRVRQSCKSSNSQRRTAGGCCTWVVKLRQGLLRLRPSGNRQLLRQRLLHVWRTWKRWPPSAGGLCSNYTESKTARRSL